MNWGEEDPQVRGPIIVSRDRTSINIRNALGAYGGPYSNYRALAVAMEDLADNYRPNFENTQPVINIPQQPQWSDITKIVSMDPFGHLTNEYYRKEIEQGLDIRPTIAITRTHMLVPEIQQEVKNSTLTVDGKIITSDTGELNVHKAAIDPVWFLPGIAERLNVEEDFLRRCLFESTGGMYPELITRQDIKVFLPPIGGTTVYIFVRKEGRALGEVTKYLVYNARKREGDLASKYFERTENVAGVKDMRFQGLMPDVFHWLGVTKIDRFMSMSNMKYDALIDAERVPIPDELIPADYKVEIDAKITAGYFTKGHIPNAEDLARTVGRDWGDNIHL
ncbi:hypothetical protein FBU30_008706 [Linnemannia zychae]|nr:hypothetical protein FBU30_008706 [Linnemannia zychae]